MDVCPLPHIRCKRDRSVCRREVVGVVLLVGLSLWWHREQWGPYEGLQIFIQYNIQILRQNNSNGFLNFLTYPTERRMVWRFLKIWVCRVISEITQILFRNYELLSHSVRPHPTRCLLIKLATAKPIPIVLILYKHVPYKIHTYYVSLSCCLF